MKNSALFLILLFTITPASKAADIQALTKIFNEEFYTSWQDRYCGRNAAHLVKTAVNAGINVDETYTFHVEDMGGFFGLVSGFRAREGGGMIKPEPENPPYFNVGRKNWYFHAFIVAKDTVRPEHYGEAFVFDMSFENAPTVLPFSEYLDRMYTPENYEANLDTRQKIFKNFKLNVYDSLAIDRTGRESTALLQKDVYLNVFYPQFFQTMDADNKF